MTADKIETILILGGGIMQIPAIRNAKEMGFRVIVADANPDAPGIKLADKFAAIDLKNHKAIAAEAVRLRKDENLRAVFTAGTDFSATVAYAATAAGLPGIDYSTAMSASNKILMRRVFAENSIPSPAFYPVSNELEAFEACMKLDFPVVIKPVDSMGARGVIRIDSPDARDAISAAVENAVAASRSGEAIVEEFIDGPEFSLDALIYEDEITICGFADRHIYFPPFFIEMGHTIPTDIPDDMRQEIETVFKRGIRALGITCGAAKGDMKYSRSKGAMVGEIAARLSGGFMSGWTFPFHSGVNLTAAAIRIAAGSPPGDLSPVFSRVSAERAAVSIPGRLVAVEGLEQAKAVEYIRDVFVSAEPGAELTFPVNNVQKCANCISAADDRDLAAAAAEESARCLFFRLEPGNENTAYFIEGKTFDWVPDAFVLTDEKNLEMINNLQPGEGAMLPEPEREAAVDWHGCGFRDAVLRIQELTECREDELTQGFWAAVQRGGILAGVWHIETRRMQLKAGLS